METISIRDMATNIFCNYFIDSLRLFTYGGFGIVKKTVIYGYSYFQTNMDNEAS